MSYWGCEDSEDEDDWSLGETFTEHERVEGTWLVGVSWCGGGIGAVDVQGTWLVGVSWCGGGIGAVDVQGTGSS